MWGAAAVAAGEPHHPGFSRKTSEPGIYTMYTSCLPIINIISICLSSAFFSFFYSTFSFQENDQQKLRFNTENLNRMFPIKKLQNTTIIFSDKQFKIYFNKSSRRLHFTIINLPKDAGKHSSRRRCTVPY
jgi:hypothetical protein